MASSDHKDILHQLLEKAGLSAPIEWCERVSDSGLTNRTSVVALTDGSKYVLREYSWPHESPDDLDRLRKEIYLHEILGQNRVPVPRILAQVKGKKLGALLLEHLPGRLLGDVAASLSSGELSEAWSSCGAALRRAHGITFPEGTSGIIAGEVVRPFEGGSWGDFHFYSILGHAERVLSRSSSAGITPETLKGLLEPAIPILNRVRPSLLHNDPHPWNVLVQKSQKEWTCSGWLDWEYAWVGDPTWDLVRMDLIRIKPVGPAPSAFYRGYGAMPQEPHRSIYELSIFLWMANQYLDGDRFLMPTYEAAMTFLQSIDTKVAEMGRLIERASQET